MPTLRSRPALRQLRLAALALSAGAVGAVGCSSDTPTSALANDGPRVVVAGTVSTSSGMRLSKAVVTAVAHPDRCSAAAAGHAAGTTNGAGDFRVSIPTTARSDSLCVVATAVYTIGTASVSAADSATVGRIGTGGVFDTAHVAIELQ